MQTKRRVPILTPDRMKCKTNTERRESEEHYTMTGTSNPSAPKETKPECSQEGLGGAGALAKRCEETIHWKRPRCW